MRQERTGNHAAGAETETDGGWFRVTYFDAHGGRIRTEEFDDLTEAKRYARCRLRDEEDWAVVDEMEPGVKSRAA